MRFAWLGCLLLWSGLLVANGPEQENNVNTRYTVESVELAGQNQSEISTGLRGELTRLVGAKLDPVALDSLATRIRRELHVRAVTHRVLRGRQAEHVRVVFEVLGRPARFDASVPKFIYQSEGGFTGTVEGTATVGSQAFTLGAVSDGDDLMERYSGVVARYEDKKLGSDRVRFRFQFESYHEQWDPATTQALDRPGAENDTSESIGRRMNFEPLATLVLARPLTLSMGFRFERFQSQFPAARTESANAMVTTLRYHRSGGFGHNQQNGRRLQPARGHPYIGQRFCVCTAPGRGALSLFLGSSRNSG